MTQALNDDALHINDNPTFEWVFKDGAGNPVDLTGKTPKIHLRFNGDTGPSLERTMTADPDQVANKGKATYTLSENDWSGVSAGYVDAKGLLIDTSGNDNTGPKDPHRFQILERLA